MPPAQVLVGEAATVDALAARSVSLAKVTALDYEILDDPMHGRALVVQLAASARPDALLSCAQRAEVLACPRTQLVVQLEYDTANRVAVDLDVKEALCSRLLGQK